jgi:hypothetical protein
VFDLSVLAGHEGKVLDTRNDARLQAVERL